MVGDSGLSSVMSFWVGCDLTSHSKASASKPRCGAPMNIIIVTGREGLPQPFICDKTYDVSVNRLVTSFHSVVNHLFDDQATKTVADKDNRAILQIGSQHNPAIEV